MEEQKAHILLVGGDENGFVLIRDMLSEFGGQRYDLDWENDLEAALAVMTTNQYDIYLVDEQLGEHSGLELLRQAIARGCVSPIIILASQDDDNMDINAMETGAVDYIFKGQIDAKELECAIRYAITHRQSEVALRRQIRAYRVLSGCNRAQKRANDERELLNDICQIVVGAGGYRMAWVGYADQDENKSVRPVSQMGWEEGYLESLDITWADVERGRGPTGTAIRTGKPVIARNIQTDPNFEPWRAAASARGYASSIALPLIVNGQTLGALNIYAAEPDAFDEDEVNLLVELADNLAFGIKTLRTQAAKLAAEEKIRRHNRDLALLNRLIATASSTLELKSILETTCRELAVALGIPLARASMLDDLGETLEVVAEYLSDDHSSALGFVMPLENYLANQYVLENNEPLAITDAQHDPRTVGLHNARQDMEVASLLILPLSVRGRVFGTIELASFEQREFGESEIALAVRAAATVSPIVQNAQNYDNAQRRLERLAAFRNIDTAIANSLDLRLVLDVLLDQVINQLKVDAAAVLLYEPYSQSLEFAAVRGFRTSALQHTSLRLGDGFAGRAALERRIIHVPDLQRGQTDFLRSPQFKNECFVTYFGVPLVSKGDVKGVLEIFQRSSLNPNAEWLDFLKVLAGQAAIAIDNATLYQNLQRSNVELTLAYDTTLEGWSRALELRDVETEGHCRRVSAMTIDLASALDVDEGELVHVRRGALLHDIGKMAIPDSILKKPSSLSDQEWKIMRQHPVYACELLSPISYLRKAMDIPCFHHEKWDGTGYPQGLKGEQIPLAARIFAVVDVWDALNSDRPYRKAWPEEKVIDYIKEQSGKHFDSRVVKAFLELVLSGSPVLNGIKK